MRIAAKSATATGLLIWIVCSTALASEGSVTIPKNADSNVVLTSHSRLENIDPTSVLQIFVGNQDECCDGKYPIAGRYQAKRQTLTFDPAFDFVEGQEYTVMYRDINISGNSDHAYMEFSIEQSVGPPEPKVVAIYPSGHVIPENTLRFYIHFSTAMQPHMSNKYIKLLDSSGKPDTAAFMSFKQELWSEDRKRLTVLMDPGRIKRGVAQNRTHGPALIEGNDYSIVIEKGWQSTKGLEITTRFEKPIEVSTALRALPDTNAWKIYPVRTLTTDALLIEFDRPYDHELAKESISILDEFDQRILGTVSIEGNDRRWRFVPNEVWKDARMKISIDPELEDVAGNNFKELLDNPISTDMNKISPKTIVLKLTALSK